MRSHNFAWILVSLLSLTLAAPLQADIMPDGDVDPTDDLWWIDGGGGSDAYIGKTATGSVTVNDGSELSSRCGYIGYDSGSTGEVAVDGSGSTWAITVGLYVGDSGQGTLNITNGGAVSHSSGYSRDGYIGHYSGSTGVVTVDGIGSTWTNTGNIYVGDSGQGTLNIANGGAVSVAYDTWVARYDGAASEIHFNGGTLTTGSLLAGPTQLTGTGTINTHGLVSDVDLLFDSADDLNQTLTLNNITINLTQDSTGALGAGYAGNGTLAIRGGVSVESKKGYIGYKAGSTGVVTVDGSGSTWICSGVLDCLYVGDSGQGTLNITNGGAVSASRGAYSCIGHYSGSTGVVTVDGIGSTWTIGCDGGLYVGGEGQGMLNITNGGTAICSWGASCDIGKSSGSTGVVTVDGSGSTLTCSGGLGLAVGIYGQGTLNITNGGAVSNHTGRIGYLSGSTGEVMVDGSGSTWTNSRIYVGYKNYGQQGMLNITNGGSVVSNSCSIGGYSGSRGVVTVDGSGSTLTCSGIGVGSSGRGTLNITNGGGAVSNDRGYIGNNSGSTGMVTVDGIGSTWTNSGVLYVGRDGRGTLNITGGGLVSVAGTLTIDYDEDGDGFINMASGGMLALYGDADDSLADFMEMINGTDAIRYWDDSILDWADITGAIYGQDYTLSYLTEGDLTGYTMLTVPEPAALSLLVIGGLAMLRRRKPR